MRKRSRTLLMSLPCLLLALLSTSSARGQGNNVKQNSSSEVGVPVPSQAESWEPDEFQRAMAAGSTIPLEPPLLLENLDLQTSIDSQSTAGQGQAKPVLGVPDSDSSSEEDSSPLPVTPSVQPHEKPSQY